jgi:serralysin
MASIIHIPANTNAGINFSADGDTYIVDAGATMSVADDNAFFGASSFSDNTIQIFGAVETTTTNTTTIQIQGSHASVQVKAGGSVTSETTAIWLQGEKSSVSNNGTIDAVDFGVRVQADGAFVKNNDTLTSDGTGIRIEGTGGEIENYDTITAGVGVKGIANAGDTLSLVNEGTITGTDFSFSGSDASDTIINRGSMIGDISLQGGDDNVNMTGGTLDGTVFGGFGDDVYTIDSTNISLEEEAGAGNDKIVSSVSFTLPANFETLQLSGSADIDATGSSKDDKLIGNGGVNDIQGKGGDDRLAGGRRGDILTGGQGADTFIFADRGGRDKVTDFDSEGSGHDTIDFSGVSGLKDFSDVKQHMEQAGGDTIITLSHRDVITLQDVKINDLHANDFIF